MEYGSGQPSHEHRRRRVYRVVWTFSVLTIVAFILSLLISNLLVARQQRNSLYQEKLRAAQLTLNQFTNHAAVPLAQNDALTLSRMLREATSISGLLYVAVVDENNFIRAHTDPARIGKTFEGNKIHSTDGRTRP